MLRVCPGMEAISDFQAKQFSFRGVYFNTLSNNMFEQIQPLKDNKTMLLQIKLLLELLSENIEVIDIFFWA
jgi:hypothetical protein